MIDALDECENEDDVLGVVQLFAEAEALGKGWLRLFLTSRQETAIRLGFDKISRGRHDDFVLHGISSAAVDQDINTYFRYELKTTGLSAQWQSEAELARLVERAGGLFIWATTACQFIKGGKGLARQKLASVLDGGSVKRGSEKKLDEIYTSILVQSMSIEYNEQDKEEVFKMFRDIVGSIAILLDPLPRAALARLLGKQKADVDQTLNGLYSVLEVPENQDSPVRFVHPSFHDFLLSEERCGNAQFWVDECKAHYYVFESCIELMSQALRKDLCGLRHPGTRAAEVDENRMSECLPPELRYACGY